MVEYDAEAMYWPMFVVAVLAAIIASQAMISATFSIIQQSLSLGCFPRVKIVHTSAKYAGQVYIPEINYLLMLSCVGVTLGFRTTAKIGNAYGNLFSHIFLLTISKLCIHVYFCIMFNNMLANHLFIYLFILLNAEIQEFQRIKNLSSHLLCLTLYSINYSLPYFRSFPYKSLQFFIFYF